MDFVLGLLGFTGWAGMGPRGQFAEFSRGMVPISGVLLFVGLAMIETMAIYCLVIALLLLSPVVVNLTKDYLSREHKRYK